MKKMSNKEKIQYYNKKFEELGFKKIKDELGKVYYLNEEYDCQVVRMETHWGIEVTDKNRNAHVYIKRFGKLNGFYQNPCKSGFPSALKWLRENDDWKIDRSGEVLYTFTEKCLWERETWNFYIEVSDSDIQYLKKFCKEYTEKSPWSDDKYRPFRISESPNMTIEEAEKLNHTCYTYYLAQHNYVGKVKIPRHKTHLHLFEKLYKGGIISLASGYNN